MANLTFAIPVPLSDGLGTIVDISTSTRNKTIQVYGTFSGIIFIEGSCEGIYFNDVGRFDLPGVQNLDDTILFVRIRRQFVADPTLIVTACVACPDAASASVVTVNQGNPGALPWPVTIMGSTPTLATEATQLLKATEATLATRATEATLATRASEATLATRLADATFTGRINTQGQKLMAASTPVVIASDQSTLPVSAAALPLPAGAATEATLALVKAKTDNLDVDANLITWNHTATIFWGETTR